MSNINRTPLGLLGLTDSQTSGVVPDEFLRSIQAGFEMAPWWAANLAQSVAEQTDVLIGNANGTAITVPNGEMWIVRHVGVSVSIIDAAGISVAAIEMDHTRGGNFWTPVTPPTAASTTAAALAADRRSNFWTPPWPFLMPSGAGFRAAQYQVNAASVNGATFVLRVCHIPIKT